MLVAFALVAAACGDDGGGGGGGTTTGAGPKDKVTVQLKWVTQAQFAGFYAAADQGYYDDVNLDVTIKPGGPNITPEQVVASGAAEFGLDWLPSLLSSREQGSDLVNIAQLYARSGMTEVTWKDSGIDSIAEMKGKKVGVWLGGNEFELFAALNKNGIDPANESDVTIVAQPFDMNLFLQREVDAAAAMTYNELAQVLEQENPDTGELYTLDDMNVLTMEDQGTGMLEDGIFARGEWLQDEDNQDIAGRFLLATFKGWAYCRDNFDACVQLVLDNGTALGEGHQTWQMNEVNALIWPAPGGIGIMQQDAFDRTAQIAQDFGVIKEAPDADAFRTDLAEFAVTDLKDEGVDVNGADFQKATVEVTAGGE